ncbi:MAG TPA: flagellar basal body-associated FliL family protein [Burkholderiaceae bacterium]
MSAAAAAADASAAKKAGGKKKLMLMILVAVLVLGAAGVGGLLYLKKRQADAEAAAMADDGGDAPAAARPEKKERDTKPPVFVPMDPFVVNLADHDADRYAQIGITLQVPDDKAGEEIKTYLPAIRNNILLLLAHKSSDDLSGSEGKEKLAREIRIAALRAMDEDVSGLDDPDAASAPAHARKRRKKSADEDLPIKSVQFSSFIIQ